MFKSYREDLFMKTEKDNERNILKVVCLECSILNPRSILFTNSLPKSYFHKVWSCNLEYFKIPRLILQFLTFIFSKGIQKKAQRNTSGEHGVCFTNIITCFSKIYQTIWAVCTWTVRMTLLPNRGRMPYISRSIDSQRRCKILQQDFWGTLDLVNHTHFKIRPS